MRVLFSRIQDKADKQPMGVLLLISWATTRMRLCSDSLKPTASRSHAFRSSPGSTSASSDVFLSKGTRPRNRPYSRSSTCYSRESCPRAHHKFASSDSIILIAMALAPYPCTTTTLHPELVSAYTTGNLARVRQIFNDTLASEPPTVRTSAAQTLLPLAIQHSHPDIVAFCPSHGAQPFFPPRQPGRVAIAFKQLDCYRQLLDAGLDVNASFGYEGNG